MTQKQKEKMILAVIISGITIAGVIKVFRSGYRQTINIDRPASVKPTPVPTEGSGAVYPLAEFKQRITKKPFGIYITSQNSPVQPERFTGYHTGVDVEYEDAVYEVPVFAVSNGEIVLAEWVSGYGGVMALKCLINGESLYFIYGHLNQTSFTKNLKVEKGDQLAILGEGETKQTDFERKHLHFGIRKDKPDIRGYVQSQAELADWRDPLEFFKSIN